MFDRKPNTKQHGFTLIEVLIALAVFSIVASITAGVLYQSTLSQKHLKQQSVQLANLQLTEALLQQDIQQMVLRPIFGNNMLKVSSVIAEKQYLEFTRDGLLNPLETARSSLQRVAWICEKDTLIRRTWPTLDTPDRNQFVDKIMVSALTHCEFSYINNKKSNVSRWHTRRTQSNPSHSLRGITVLLNLPAWGEGTWWFPTSQAKYTAMPRGTL